METFNDVEAKVIKKARVLLCIKSMVLVGGRKVKFLVMKVRKIKDIKVNRKKE